MLKRISRLRSAKVNSVGIGSVFQAGDTNEINMKVKVLADQRTLAVYRDDEGSFNRKEYPIFQQPAVMPLPETGVQSAFCHENPSIRVRNVKVQGVSSASVVQIGSSSVVLGDSRLKHIRQIVSPSSQSSQT
ncbi:spore germination protein GerPE [Bacillus sp. L381]|uniref:spore germination protein GerPE n=1 Tax=Bacillus TaxID=1386 RepID=UPI001BAACD50|nr:MULTISPECIES: spore germination protein GerPE [Bacillus]MCR9037631.1 spore germination protein GerPE [Bacillus velezensis]QUN10550.1 spore germination protein GerPE [Bacillus amyloliquefaciens]QYM83681.1 spore germination protein GerPE [Bacillus sp. 7D3]QZY12866.1 spore germination protein GerPE [Bacillus amyloliquefaciens]WIX22680.1 spore germination protein GerPE [Bacillus sp. L381]